MSISVIIPALNEQSEIARTIQSICGAHEIIVADGGSRDDTVRIALAEGARVVHSPRGRGVQMHAGALASTGDVFLFLHADTRPAAEALRLIDAALRDPKVIAGNFCLRFSGSSSAARWLTRIYPRLSVLGLCYGDSGLFVRREIYELAGGFQPYPVFEDLDLLRRLRRAGRVVRLPGTLETSSRRFENASFPLLFGKWTLLQFLYWIGVHPRVLGRFYAPKTERTIPS